ncbi:iron-containing alcohol dehydrogenase [Lachnospiraceae bacterium NSJ-143]|nr:iron-containing alcohol dehydrogenase [Lachnospiraceae bacterium NSJ-143]
MKQLNFKTDVYTCPTFDEFIKEFSVGGGDVVVTIAPFVGYFDKGENKPFILRYEDFGSGEPSDTMVEDMRRVLSGISYSRIIAVGGGAVIDTAKLLKLANEPTLEDIYVNKAQPVCLKRLVAVPTTCGTGSEVTNISVMAFEKLNTKLGRNADELFADETVLITEAIKNLPYSVMMSTSIDALIHAVESYLSPKATAYTEIFSEAAVKMILRSYMNIDEKGHNGAEAELESLLIASDFAGIAFGYAGAALVHACAMLFGCAYHVPHGESTYLFFTECLKFYEEKNPDGEKLVKLKDLIAGVLDTEPERAIEAMERLIDRLYPLKRLESFGMKSDECGSFAQSVYINQQRLIVNSFINVDEKDVEELFRRRY